MNLVNTCTIILSLFTLILTRNEFYSIYHLVRIRNESDLISSFLSLLLFSCVTAGLTWDYLTHSILILNITYVSILSLKFWIQQIWSVSIKMKYLRELELNRNNYVHMLISLYSIFWTKSTLESLDEASKAKRCILYFKGIGILVNEYNVAFGIIAVPFVKIIIITLLVFSLFACARLFRQLSFISGLFVSSVAFMSTLVIVLSAMVMSYFFETSSRFSKNLS